MYLAKFASGDKWDTRITKKRSKIQLIDDVVAKSAISRFILNGSITKSDETKRCIDLIRRLTIKIY